MMEHHSKSLCHLQVTGLLHVIHNAAAALSSTLSHYDTWLAQVKLVCALLRPPWRQRFLHTCVLCEATETQFMSFSGRPYEQRWGTVTHAVGELLRVEDALRQCWSLSEFSFAHASGDHMSTEPSVPEPPPQTGPHAQAGDIHLKVEHVDKAVCSPLFWSYTKTMHLLMEILHQLELWVEGCSCHCKAEDLQHLALRRTASVQSQAAKCPLRGRRSHEMATGAFEQLALSLFQSGNHTLLSVASVLDRSEARSCGGLPSR